MHADSTVPGPGEDGPRGRPALFLDRDGVLNRLIVDGYVTRPEEFEWLPGARLALRRARDAGWPTVVVTNQAGVGRGRQSHADLDAVHDRLRREAADAGGPLAGVYACPHTPEDGCDCRKPRPGLLLRAAADLGLDLSRSWLVGDSPADLGAAERAGIRCLLVRTGRGALTAAEMPDRPADQICDDIGAAVERIGPCPQR